MNPNLPYERYLHNSEFKKFSSKTINLNINHVCTFGILPFWPKSPISVWTRWSQLVFSSNCFNSSSLFFSSFPLSKFKIFYILSFQQNSFLKWEKEETMLSHIKTVSSLAEFSNIDFHSLHFLIVFYWILLVWFLFILSGIRAGEAMI